jgi:hypothetical protein
MGKKNPRSRVLFKKVDIISKAFLRATDDIKTGRGAILVGHKRSEKVLPSLGRALLALFALILHLQNNDLQANMSSDRQYFN